MAIVAMLIFNIPMALGLWHDLVEVARWAPSPHNTQPWIVRPKDEHEADLFMVARRRLPDEDTTGCFLICAMGIFIEALRIAAANRGYSLNACRTVKLDYTQELIHFANLHIARGSSPDEFSDQSILDRRTSRLKDAVGEVGQDVIARAQVIANRYGHEIECISDSMVIDSIFQTNAVAVLHDLADPKYGGEIRTWYRYTASHARRTQDGLDARCMNIPALEMWLSANAPLLLRVPGVRHAIKSLYKRRVGSAQRLLVIRGPFFERDAAEQSGAMLLRAWLALHEGGCSIHPFGNLVTNPEAYAWLCRTLNRRDIWLVVRVACTHVPPRSCRLDTDKIIHAH